MIKPGHLLLMAAILSHSQHAFGDEFGTDEKPPEKQTLNAPGKPDDIPNNGQDPTRPLWRLDVRYMYQMLPGNSQAHILTLRADAPVKLPEGWKIIGRVDMPFICNDVTSADNPRGGFRFGTGDLLLNAIVVHETVKDQSAAIIVQMIFPTASADQLGQGKWQLLPGAGYRFALNMISKGTFLALILRYDFDVAGAADRAHINQLEFGPMFNIMLPRGLFVTLYPNQDIRCDLNTGKWFVPLDFMLGWMPMKKLVISVEVGIPLLKDMPLYDFKIEGRVGYFF
jgi:hypothetical protein